jgi:hypothetical protein
MLVFIPGRDPTNAMSAERPSIYLIISKLTPGFTRMSDLTNVKSAEGHLMKVPVSKGTLESTQRNVPTFMFVMYVEKPSMNHTISGLISGFIPMSNHILVECAKKHLSVSRP